MERRLVGPEAAVAGFIGPDVIQTLHGLTQKFGKRTAKPTGNRGADGSQGFPLKIDHRPKMILVVYGGIPHVAVSQHFEDGRDVVEGETAIAHTFYFHPWRPCSS
jgi:hypothetical protein